MPRAVGAVACLAPGLEDLGAVAVAADRLARVVLADGACPGPCLLAQADQEVGGIGSIGPRIQGGVDPGHGVGETGRAPDREGRWRYREVTGRAGPNNTKPTT